MSKTYVTVQGDKWDKIAHEQCGDVAHTDKLISTNPEYRNIYIFPSGIRIVIPELEKSTANIQNPPWKKVEG